MNIFSYKEPTFSHYFKVIINKEEVLFFECFIEYLSLENDLTEEKEILKAELTPSQWEVIKSTVQYELNEQLKEEGKHTGRFKKGENYIPKLLGKQLLLLVWAIEDTDNEKDINNAIRNWKGFSREEQWWLFTMVNAASGQCDDRFGWRAGIKEALLFNPVKGGR